MSERSSFINKEDTSDINIENTNSDRFENISITNSTGPLNLPSFKNEPQMMPQESVTNSATPQVRNNSALKIIENYPTNQRSSSTKPLQH